MAISFQLNIRQKKYRFSFRIGFFLFVIFFFCLMCELGVWQLHRYHYKKTLLQEFQERSNEPSKPFLSLTNPASMPFQPAVVKGTYLNQLTLLIQNQFYHDQLGYDVITPFQIQGRKQLLLVDRGWIPKPNGNQNVQIENINGQQEIAGYIKLLDEYHFTLGKNTLEQVAKPIVMQKIDVKELSQITHASFYPFILRLNASQPNGFVRDWTIVTVMPERHMAYAVQWFAMAIALFIAYIIFCCERINNANE